ncbi:uncharacterized protein LOC143022613 [Oratosquilla oratoria]|uniref:uncharacterized protein LOC143022608 n=1 Tax=Oratosquilla oratoria TaxID=337810 RepID=UPI003F75E8AE
MNSKVCFLLVLLCCSASMLTQVSAEIGETFGAQLGRDPVEIETGSEYLKNDIMKLMVSASEFSRNLSHIMCDKENAEEQIPISIDYVHVSIKSDNKRTPIVNVGIPPQKFYFPLKTLDCLQAPEEPLERLFAAPRSIVGERPEFDEVFANPRMMRNFEATYDNPKTREIAHRIVLLSNAAFKFVRSVPGLQKPTSDQPTYSLQFSSIPITLFRGAKAVTFVVPPSKLSLVDIFSF